jgi:sugar lactone lactonase YvrE
LADSAYATNHSWHFAQSSFGTITLLRFLGRGSITKSHMNKILLALMSLAFGAISLLAQPVITQQPANQIVLNGGSATFSVSVDGSVPFSCQWQFNGTNVPQIITTVAGNGNSGYSGDGGLATNASIMTPYGVTADNNGSFYFSDYSFCIRKVTVDGIITTFAGSGSSGFSGDGGLATSASLKQPFGVCMDAFGNCFIADYGNNRVRMVDTNGIIRTVAGNGTSGYNGDGGAATNASLYSPTGVAVDSQGNLFIADRNNNCIREVDTNGIITTVAGNGAAGFLGDGGMATNANLNHPFGVAADADGNLFIADSGNNRIRCVNSNGIITTLAGTGNAGYSGDGGPASNANLNFPSDVKVDRFGFIYFADVNNSRVRGIDPSGVITTVAGSATQGYSGDGGSPTTASLKLPFAIALDAFGSLLVCDMQNFRVRKVSLGSRPILQLNNVTTNNVGTYQVAVTSLDGSVTSGVVNLTVVLNTSPQHQLVISGSPVSFGVAAYGQGPFAYQWYFNTNTPVDGGTNAALTFNNTSVDKAGVYSCVISSGGASVTSSGFSLVVFSLPSIVAQPSSVTVSAGNSTSFSVGVSGTGPFTYQWRLNGTNLPDNNNIITRVAGINSSKNFSGDGGLATVATMQSPSSLALDRTGNLYIVDQPNNRVRAVDTNGIINTVAGGGSQQGDGVQATNEHLNLSGPGPACMALDSSGNYYFTESGNNRVRRVDTNGIVSTVAGNGNGGFSGDGGLALNAQLNNPTGIAVDKAGNVFIGDRNNLRIRKVGTNGIITTVAGNGTVGFSGDGGAAINAALNFAGLAVDGAGNLLIADLGNQRIRKVDSNGIINTIAGNGSQGFSGDNGFATNAALNTPYGVAVDVYNDVYIADYYNSRIRMVSPVGIISTVAGTGNLGYSGDGGTATNASLGRPMSVGLDVNGNLYFGDNYYAVVRKVGLGLGHMLQLNNVSVTNAGNYDVVISSAYGSVTSSVVNLTVVSSASPQSQAVLIGNPVSFSVAAYGAGPFSYQWYFNNNAPVVGATNAVLSIDNSTSEKAGNYVCIVSNASGSATSSVFSLTVVMPPSIVTQPANQTVINGTNAFFTVGVSGTGPFTYQWQLNGTNLPDGTITTVVGKNIKNGPQGFFGDGGQAANATLSSPGFVSVDSLGNMFFSDQNSSRIRKVDPNGIITTVAGNGTYTGSGTGSPGNSGDGGAATNATLGWFVAGQGLPIAPVADDIGNLFIADMYNHRIRKVDTNGIITTVAGSGPAGPNQGSYSGDGGQATNATLNYPTAVALDAARNLVLADSGNNRVRKISPDGTIMTIAGTGAANFSGDGGVATSATLNSPKAVAVDKFGSLFIADQVNNRIRKIDTNGTITTVAGSGPAGLGTGGYSGDGGPATNATLNRPAAVAVDASGSIIIWDAGNYRIRKVDTSGVITTVAGNGINNTSDFSGDGGAATNVALNFAGLAVDAFGDLFVTHLLSDGNGRIREVASTKGPTLKISNLTANNAGNYSVIVSNSFGVVTSSIASLTVNSSPSIAMQPTNCIVLNGGAVSLNASAIGNDPLVFQWFTSPGHTATAFVTLINNGQILNCIVTDGGFGYTSSPQVHFIDAFGTGAGGYGVVSNGAVTSIIITNSGQSYGRVPYPAWTANLIDPPTTNVTAMPGQTNSSLPFAAATGADAASYFVVVTNNYGSVTSTLANLTVLLPPQGFSGQTVSSGGGLQLQFSGTPSYPYILQMATNLMPPVNWQPVLTNPADGNGNWNFTVTNVPALPAGYYRVLGQ